MIKFKLKKLNLFKFKQNLSKLNFAKTINFSELKVKNSLLRNLISIFALTIFTSLVISGAITFFITKNKVTNDFKASTLEILNLNKKYVDLMSESIDNLSMQLSFNDNFTSSFYNYTKDDYDRAAAINKIQTSLKNVANNNSNLIKNIFVYNNTNEMAQCSDVGVVLPDNLKSILDSTWYKNITEQNIAHSWLPPHPGEFTDTSLQISYVRLLSNPSSLKVDGLLKINLSPDVLNSAMQSAKIGKNGYIIIVDNTGTIISHKDTSMLGKKVDDNLFSSIKNKSQGDIDFTSGKTTMYGVYTTSASTNWKFIAIVPKSELSATAVNIGMITLLITIVCIIFAIVICYFTVSKITNSINDMILITRELSLGNFTVQCKDSSYHELKLLNNNFNKMI